MVSTDYLRKYMKFCTQKHQNKANTNIELGKLDLIFKVTLKGHSKWYPLYMWRNIWLILTKFGTKKQQGWQKTFLKVALSYSGGVSPTVVIKQAYFEPFGWLYYKICTKLGLQAVDFTWKEAIDATNFFCCYDTLTWFAWIFHIIQVVKLVFITCIYRTIMHEIVCI